MLTNFPLVVFCVMTIITDASVIASNGNVFDWNGAMDIVQQQKELWQQQDIDTYVYHYKENDFSDPLGECYRAWKYVLVFDGEVKYVEYDQLELSRSDLDCTIINAPIIYDKVHTIDDIFDIATINLQKRIDCLDGISNDIMCDQLGTATIENDSRLHYLKKLKITNPLVGTNTDYEFGCFTSFTDWESPTYGQFMYPDECLVDLSMMLELYQLFNPDDDDPHRHFRN